jgi:hypothetical protein
MTRRTWSTVMHNEHSNRRNRRAVDGYPLVCLFVRQVFPWVNICALINNIFELRADAFKYCYVYQRPIAQPAWNIGQSFVRSLTKRLFDTVCRQLALRIRHLEFGGYRNEHGTDCDATVGSQVFQFVYRRRIHSVVRCCRGQ